jgi:hypothetical protein
MKNIQKISYTLLLALCFIPICFAGNASWYSDPITYNKRYIINVEQVILESMTQFDWQVKQRSPGKITAWLNNYKGYELILDIVYDDTSISFKHVGYKKVDCRKSCGKAETKYYDKWRLYLRRNIALNIHKYALSELFQNKNIWVKWMNTINKGTYKEQIKLARNIIDIQYYEDNTLQAIEQAIKNSNYKNPAKGDQVQQLAFYCKALAYSKDKKYHPILEQVRDGTSSKKLRRYIEVYFEHISET